MDRRAGGGGLDLLARRAVAAVADIVADRVVEQHRVLRDDAERRAQARLGHLAMSWPSMVIRPAVGS